MPGLAIGQPIELLVGNREAHAGGEPGLEQGKSKPEPAKLAVAGAPQGRRLNPLLGIHGSTPIRLFSVVDQDRPGTGEKAPGRLPAVAAPPAARRRLARAGSANLARR